MSAPVHAEAGREEDVDHLEVPVYIRRIMFFIERVGGGPPELTPLWKAITLIAVYLIMTVLTPLNYTYVAGLPWRISLPSIVLCFCYATDFVGMIYMARMIPDASPWTNLDNKLSVEILKETFSPIGPSLIIFIGSLFAMMVSYAYDECARRGLDPPGPEFIIIQLISMSYAIFHMFYDCLTFQYLGVLIAAQQEAFIKKIADRLITFEEAIREHREMHQRHRMIFKVVTIEGNLACSMFMFLSIINLYEYFVMPWGHWSHIYFYCLNVLGMCIVWPIHWTGPNENQDALQVMVAEAVESVDAWKEKESVLKDPVLKGEGDALTPSRYNHVGEKTQTTELWNARERTSFLIYLQTTMLKVSAFNWPVGLGFIMEICILYATYAFVMWQISALNGWSGLSFDREES